MAFDWKIEISKMVYIKQVIADLDHNKLWPHHFPEVAATEDNIIELEQKIGTSVGSRFSNFLLHANGWQGLYQSVDLLGTSELIGGEKMDFALSMLRTTATENLGVSAQDLLPIGLALNDMDLFCLDLRSGEVIWFAGSEIERFPHFEEFFMAMLDYNREEIEDLKSDLDDT